MMRKWIVLSLIACSCVLSAQEAPFFEVDPSFPKPLPTGWINGQVGGICIDSHDHVTIVDRRNITEEETETAVPTPPIMMFNLEGDLINSFGNPDLVPRGIHSCFFDTEDNVWVGGNQDSIAQKYSHAGKLLMQIGTKDVFDTVDGTLQGGALNSGKEHLHRPSAVVVDPDNGDIFISDGYGNRRVVVFDKNGNFLRQWGRQATEAEIVAGTPGTFANTVHCIAMNNSGEIYVCDRFGDRIQVFNKMGGYLRSIHISEKTHSRGTAWSVAFSPDLEQEYLYVVNGGWEKIEILDHANGISLAAFGRPGHQIGHFTHAHTVAVDSTGSIYVAETSTGRRVQRFNRSN